MKRDEVSTELSAAQVKVSRWSTDGDRQAIALSLTRAISYALLFAIPILIGGILLGKDILYYMYSASFSAGFIPLVILLVARAFQSVSQLFYTFLMALDAVRDAFLVVLAGSAVNLALAAFLIPAAGLAGAAVGTLAAVVTCLILSLWRIRRYTEVVPDTESILRFLGAAAVMGLVVLAGRALIALQTFWKPLILTIVGAAVYFGILLLVDAGLREDARRTFRIRWKG